MIRSKFHCLKHSWLPKLLKRKTHRKNIATCSSSPASNLSAPNLLALIPIQSGAGKTRPSRAAGSGALTLQNHELAGQQLGRGFYCTLKNSHFFSCVFVHAPWRLRQGKAREKSGREQGRFISEDNKDCYNLSVPSGRSRSVIWTSGKALRSSSQQPICLRWLA